MKTRRCACEYCRISTPPSSVMCSCFVFLLVPLSSTEPPPPSASSGSKGRLFRGAEQEDLQWGPLLAEGLISCKIWRNSRKKHCGRWLLPSSGGTSVVQHLLTNSCSFSSAARMNSKSPAQEAACLPMSKTNCRACRPCAKSEIVFYPARRDAFVHICYQAGKIHPLYERTITSVKHSYIQRAFSSRSYRWTVHY